MADGHGTFNTIARGLWAPFRWLASRPVERGTLEQRLQRMEGEQAVRDLLAQYAFSYDSSDVDGVMALFADDAVLVNARGTFAGRQAIDDNYRWVNAQRQAGFHFITNTLVRVDSDGPEAWVTAYFQSWAVDLAGERRALLGTYAMRLVKLAGQWKIADCRITSDISTGQAPGPPPSLIAADAPAPTSPETSDDWSRE
jgi:uncharacterized protein (TIGR02246 family)